MSEAHGRLFLLGATGWLGSAIRRSLPDAVAVRSVEDLTASRPTGSDVIINAAGSKDAATMEQANVDLVAALARLGAARSVPIVHLGSAAEYGVALGDQPLREDAWPGDALSQYGRTKLAATQILREYGNACVLRVFNVVSNPPQPGSPLEELTLKAKAAAENGTPPQLWAAETVRDWITKDFVVQSVVAAVRLRPVGVFNVCSGVPVAMAQLMAALLSRTGARLPVVDLHRVPANTVVGDPSAWTACSGLAEPLTAAAIAAILIPDLEVKA